MTTLNKPTLQLLSELKGNNYLKKDLLEFGGYDSIHDAKRTLGLNKASDVYHYLLKDYNETIKDINNANKKKFEKQIAKWINKESSRKLNETKAKRLEKKLAKQQTTLMSVREILYENAIKIDKVTIHNPYTYKINAIELAKIKKAMKGQQCLFQQKIEFFNDKGKVINKSISTIEIVYDIEILCEKEKIYIYDFTTMVFETMKIKKEFAEKIQSNMICSGFLYHEKNGYIWKPEKLLEINENYYTIITTKALAPIISSSSSQNYAAADTGTCVYDGVVSYFEHKLYDKNAKAIYNKLIKNKQQYAKTYTDETIATELAPFCKSSITIKNLINGKDKIFNQNLNNKFNIEFLNTKFNHLDQLVYTYKNVQEVEYEELIELKKTLPFYIEKFGSVITLDKTYKCIESEFKELYMEWKNNNEYDNYFIYTDSDEHKMLSNYDYKLHIFINILVIIVL